MEDLRAIVERFWKDVASLPWKDKVWTTNAPLQEQTRQHYVNATYNDLSKLIEQPALEIVIAKLDAMMVDAPNRELADCSNYLQGLLDKEDSNATDTSNDQE